MPIAKKHIEQIVRNYIRLYPKDYEIVKKGIEMQRGLYLDDFASAKHSGSATTRALYEIPERLHEMLVMGLEEEEMVWLKSGGASHKEGGRWFAKTFPAFKLPRNI